jgi:polysaccharide pyruvyl transferase WcaK-like protein
VVVPDLAVALRPVDAVARRPGEVVVGVMAYDGPGSDQRRHAEVREAYAASMTDLVVRLLDRGRTVTLVIGDAHDEPAVEELRRRVASVRPDAAADSLQVSRAHTFEDLMAVMGGADAVIASRFHNVVAAVMAARPTVSLGYASKNVDLLRAAGLPPLDQPIGAIDVDLALCHLEVATAHGETAQLELRPLAQQVDEQFTRVFAEFLPA